MAVSLVGSLAACGGDSGGVASTPTPTATATPTPTPTPTPTATSTPASVFQTTEYYRSSGAPYHQAIAAWEVGATGKGVTLGIVDSGIDTTNPEFTGRIATASADVAGNRGIVGTDDHGTQVALTAAAARNGTGVMGIAYDATILMARADTIGSCASSSGCSFSDSAIAAGVDLAVANGAKVVNLSLGGSAPDSVLVQAVARAAAAGVVVIVAAGNDGQSTTPGVDPSNPDPFATGLQQAGNGNVIIVGSVNDQGVFSAFSNRAGSEAANFLSALGEGVCCVYANGQIKVTTSGGQQFVTVVNGTSFAAPQVSAAVALLRQAFPNLTAAQVVSLLLSTATDAGAVGTDATYGRGILNIAAAFAPQGATTLAGTTTQVALTGTSLITSAAMGDAVQAASAKATVLDGYGRAYQVDLASRARTAMVAPRLAGALLGQGHAVDGGAGPLSLAFTVGAAPAGMAWSGQLRLAQDQAQGARVLAGRMIARLSPHAAAAFAYAQGADGLAMSLRGADRPAFLVAGGAADDFGFARGDLAATALRWAWRGWGITLSADGGRVLSPTGTPAPLSPDPVERDRFSRFGVTLDRPLGRLHTALSASWLAEDRTVLGARLASALAPGGADSLFVDLAADWRIGDRWQAAATLRRGQTHARGSQFVAAGSNLASTGWSVDLARRGVFAADDSVALRVAQPLRVEGGSLNLSLPGAWNYDTLAATTATRTIALTPSGREIDAELAWRAALWGGTANASLFWRREPGHVATMPDDEGLALGWRTDF